MQQNMVAARPPAAMRMQARALSSVSGRKIMGKRMSSLYEIKKTGGARRQKLLEM
jgi:hypothetical protein